MKNTLAENMLRFGVKNLQESDIKKIKKSSLNEGFSGTFEQCFPDYKAANAVFKKAYAAGEPKPFYAGKYHYFYTIKKLPDTAYSQYEIGIIGLGLRRFKDIIIPDVCSVPNSEYVTAYWGEINGLGSNSSWPELIQNLLKWRYDNSTIGDMAGINSRFNSITPERIQLMLPQYPKLVATLASMKTNTNWVNRQKFYEGLSPKAKMFYGSMGA